MQQISPNISFASVAFSIDDFRAHPVGVPVTDLIPVPDMQMVWMRLLAPKSPSFTFPEESSEC